MQLKRKSKPSLLDNPYFCAAMEIAKPAHYFKKIERCFCSYQQLNRLFFAKKIDKCTYQVREKDSETGKEAFQLRLWDARIGRWLMTDPAGQYHSPYLGMGNSPVNGIDFDGGIFVRGKRYY